MVLAARRRILQRWRGLPAWPLMDRCNDVVGLRDEEAIDFDGHLAFLRVVRGPLPSVS
jgi:hypothetical protein